MPSPPLISQQQQPDLRRDYSRAIARQMQPVIHALMLVAVPGFIAATITSSFVAASDISMLLRLAPAIPMLLIALASRRTREAKSLNLLMLACVLMLEIGINLNGIGRALGPAWVLPGSLLIPVATASVWPSRWSFVAGMGLSALGPLPMLLLAAGNTAEVIQYAVYMVIAVSLSTVLRAFMTRTLFEQFRLEQRLREQANTDGLTGLLLRNRFLELAQDALDGMRIPGDTACILYLDADRFKQLNDDYGHATGDLALIALADCLRAQARKTDLIGRIGGEEFALLLPGLNLEQAEDRAEKLRLATHQILRPDGPLTVSIGIAECHSHGETTDALLARADKAMRHAKQNGRDQVVATVRTN